MAIIDLGNTAFFCPSIVGANPASGAATVGLPVDLKDTDSFCNVWVVATACSGPFTIQVQTTDTTSGAIFNYSGNNQGGLPVSGTFTDPTSGLASSTPLQTFPTWFNSGGLLIVNSGLYPIIGGGAPLLSVSGFPLSGGPTQAYQGGFPPGTFPFGLTPTIQSMGGPNFQNTGSFPMFASGGMAIAGFQRPNRYARLLLLSGSATTVMAGFISQFDTTGVGGGFSWQPAASSGQTGANAIGMPVV